MIQGRLALMIVALVALGVESFAAEVPVFSEIECRRAKE
jgi:hypothetical protein